MPDKTKTEEGNSGNLPEEVAKVLEDIKQKLENPNPDPQRREAAPALPSAADRRESMRKRMGFTEDQMQAHEEMIMRSQAPIIEQTAWSQIEKKTDLEKYRKDIEKELEIYPQDRRTPAVLEKIYFMVKGRAADSKPTDPKPAPKGSPRVEGERVSRGPGYSGAEPGLSSGGSEINEDEAMKLSDEEKFVAAKLGVPETDYAKSRNAGKEIRKLRVPDQREAKSLADIELRRMTSR